MLSMREQKYQTIRTAVVVLFVLYHIRFVFVPFPAGLLFDIDSVFSCQPLLAFLFLIWFNDQPIVTFYLISLRNACTSSVSITFTGAGSRYQSCDCPPLIPITRLLSIGFEAGAVRGHARNFSTCLNR
ncbi:uncharacterized protein LY79DRAFT_237236 [Colletotrichum navitas]|uniref:Uncharacterized protein n=1 Tax=Colletotrichum navitas TaxID=681940 RepID=A0AAD8PXX2_9PEZI|nr:uncharacterized protein LY79DRAFT_237236 [Colletotrichum navitas]KAK1589642.1 hypothetical protein LY79DRAFT_237236 [Colletotrichum navitas]